MGASWRTICRSCAATIEQEGVPPVTRHTTNIATVDERVEVEPAEIGAQAAGPAEAVAVGDVGVEGGPHEVEAGAHGAGRGPAVAAGRGVAELVEARRDSTVMAKTTSSRPGLVEGLVRRRGQSLREEHPPATTSEGEHHEHDHERAEQQRERAGEPTGALGLGDGVPEPQRRAAGWRFAAPARCRRPAHETERAQLSSQVRGRCRREPSRPRPR